jgi:hypothetical protein
MLHVRLHGPPGTRRRITRAHPQTALKLLSAFGCRLSKQIDTPAEKKKFNFTQTFMVQAFFAFSPIFHTGKAP